MSVSIGSQFTQRFYQWTDWKIVNTIKNGQYQYNDDGAMYKIWFYDGPEVHLCNIWKDTVPYGIVNGGYSQEQNNLDKIDFEDNYKLLGNKQINKIDSEGRPVNVPVPRIGTDIIIVSHNFSDPCSWYQKSVRVNNENLISENGYIWNTPNVNLIDIISGRIYHDYLVKLETDHQYEIIVMVDGYQKTAREPYDTEGGDYIIYYEDGYIESLEDWTGKEILCSYSYATTSEWALIPPSGKKIDIEVADVQFTSDVIMDDTIVFDTYVYNPYDFPNKVIYETTYFKNMKNIIEEALGQYPLIPKFNGIRGTSSETIELPFRYGAVKTLIASTGVEIVIRLLNNKPFIGNKNSFATVTFYGTIRDE